jgi:hypothetical protein
MTLVPGYYNLTYNYRPDFVFTTAPSGIKCGATPAAAGLSGTLGSGAGTTLFQPATPTSTESYGIDILAAFIANGQLVSTPWSSHVSVRSTSSYVNPDSNLADTPPTTTTVSATTAPTVPPDNISLTNYQASTVSALLDICGYSNGWTSRSVNFQIQKTGEYWLMFSSEMAAAASSSVGGGALDNVSITALGSLAMSPSLLPTTSSGTPYITVPVGDPQPGSTITSSDGRVTIVADPPTFPAAMQP